MEYLSIRRIAVFQLVGLFIATVGCSPTETPEQKEVATLMAKANAEAEKLKPTKPSDRSLLEKMRVTKDEMRELNFYNHAAPHNIASTDIRLYIVESKEGLTPHVRHIFCRQLAFREKSVDQS